MTGFDDENVIRRRARRLSGLLAETDSPARPMAFPVERVARASHRSVVRWRAAAGIALLIAGAAGVTPVRAWIVQAVGDAWRAVTGRSAETAVVAIPAPLPRGSMGAVAFPAMDPLAVRIAVRQVSGELVIEQHAEPTVSLAIIGEPNAAELVVLPEGARIVNRAASSAGYRLLVPVGVSRVTVQIGNERPRIIRPAGSRTAISLGSESSGAAR